MSYCQAGTKALVSWEFAKSKDSYVTYETPIDVEIISNSKTFTFTGSGLHPYPQCGADGNIFTFSYEGRNYTIQKDLFYLPNYGQNNCPCDVVYVDGERKVQFAPGSIKVVSRGEANCIINIKNNQKLLYSASGECPCNFRVACDDECPPGTVKCFSINYPGYCCLPCESTKAEIRAMTQQVRRLNRG